MATRCGQHEMLQIFIDNGASANDICSYYFEKIMAGNAILTNDMLLLLYNNDTNFGYVINGLNKN
jgi:hypothetical protein